MYITIRTWISLLALLFSIGGCATSEPVRGGYDAEKDATAFETQSIPIRMNRSNALGLQGKQLVTMRGAAACIGRDCLPGEVLLVFANEGDNETMLNYEMLTLEADGENYHWEDLLERQEAVRVPPGDFLRLPVKRAAFEQIAQAQDVSGTLGGAPFRLSYEERAPLRALMLRMGPAQ